MKNFINYGRNFFAALMLAAIIGIGIGGAVVKAGEDDGSKEKASDGYIALQQKLAHDRYCADMKRQLDEAYRNSYYSYAVLLFVYKTNMC